MKRVVLYAGDFEPITVINLNHFAWDMLNRLGFVRLPVLSPPSFLAAPDAPGNEGFRVVNIQAEKIKRGDHESLMLFTADEESALLLRAAFLPGQRSVLQELQWNAFACGFNTAINKLGKSC